MSEIKKWNTKSSKKDFESIFHRIYSPLCGYALKILKSSEQAEEVVQEVFLKLWEQKNRLEIENIDSYLYRSVYNKSLHIIAHNKVVQKYADSYIGNNDSLPTPEEGIIVGEMYAVYREQLKKLPEKTRNIFLLSRNQGLKYSEIAEKLNISVKTVEANMSKALKVFRECFNYIK